MTLEIRNHKKKEIYDEFLNSISNIKFTHREIDVIACILHHRGEKKIASLLSISPRTVSAHIHNIMLKLGRGSREYIIDFIEKSGKLSFIKKYYFLLLVQNSFEAHLMKIGKIINKQGITCTLNCKQVGTEEKNILNQIKAYLKLANVDLKDTDRINEDIKSNFYVLTDELIPNQQQINSTVLIINKNNNACINYEANDYLDFNNKEQYYFLIFELLKKVIDHNGLEGIIQEFVKEYQAIKDSFQTESEEAKKLIESSFLKSNLTKRSFIILLAFLMLLISWIIIFQFFIKDKTINLNQITIDLPLPHENTLLARRSILSKMEEKLTNNNSINTIALVGVGGSGKTTIARQYARYQKIALIWEINCETRDSIISSFKQLAYSLCKTEEEKQQLIIMLETKEKRETEKKLFIFLTKKIKHYHDWLVIYNNVKTFKDIQEYFPYDSNVWGNGKIIITTTDSNIASNSYILAKNVIHVGALNKEEKLELFSKIIYDSKNPPNNQHSMIINFLEKIPPFPLDISVAASYIKELKTSYTEYLKYIAESKEEFITVQKTILNDISEYNKTRYDIVTLSIKHIIEKYPDFADLLLLISLIDSEDIPKDLLIRYKNDIIVSQFIHELKKFSLITEKSPTNNEYPATLSIHRSTQEITLAYLAKELKLEQDTKQILDISNILESIITDELKIVNSNKISLLAHHIEMYLINNKWLNEEIISSLYMKLGIHYFHVANYKKAQECFETALIIYKKKYGIEHLKIAEASGRLGGVFRSIGKYKESIVLHELALKVFQKNYGNEDIKTILISTYLGSSYRHLGKYIKARNLLEHALTVHKKEYGIEHIKTARTSGYLGNVYHDIGEYAKAKELLEHAFNVYTDHYGKDNIQTAWISVRLSNLYRSIGEYEKAKKLIAESIVIYKHYDKNSIKIAWSLLHLGNIFIELGNYYEAQKSLEKSLIIYKKNYSTNHIDTARVLNSLGVFHLLTNNLDTAEILINQALVVFQQSEHPESFISLDKLADLYIKKSKQKEDSGNILQAQLFRQKAVSYLKQAKAIVEKDFPANSPYVEIIKDKLAL